MRRRATPQEYVKRLDFGAAWVSVLCFALVAYLGLRGGGYDPLVHDQVGIAIWWVVLIAVAVGALPRLRPGPPAWAALGLLGAFVAWTALSLTWTESIDKTSADLARVTLYLGILVLALLSRRRGDARRVIGAVAAAIVLVAVVGMLSRLHPSWFPGAAATGRFLEDPERLSYPLNYWNGLAGLIAIGMPLLLQLAVSARSALGRGLAAAALPALALTAFMTLSRGGIAAAILVLVLYLALAADRLPRLLTLLVAGAGGALLIVALHARDALQSGLMSEAANRQGTGLLWIAIAVCLAVGLIQVGLTSDRARGARPVWSRLSRRQALYATLAALAVTIIVALAAGAPGRIADGWQEFKQGGGPGSGAGRLGSVAGQSRYQLWSSAARENASAPWKGTGSGTFEFWWARDGDTEEIVRDTHSLYLQTLGELGIVGLALLASFLALMLIAGVRLLSTADEARRSLIAAALAGLAAFCITAAFDWMWQLPVLPAAALLLGSLLLTGRGTGEEGGRLPFRPGLRVAVAAVALAAIAAIAIPLASTTLVRQSEADAREGDLSGALEKARTAQNVQPDTAGPRLQQALVLGQQDRLAAAGAAAAAAAEREPTNWRNWLVLARIEAERGRAGRAVADYRRARSLNPRSPIFRR